jgi:hypothetical protein
MGVVAKGVKLLGNAGQRVRIGRDVPKRLLERPVAEVSAEQQEVMADRRSLLAPLSDEARGERMTEIVNAGPGAVAGGDEIVGQGPEGAMDGALAEGAAAPRQEKPIGEGGMPRSFRQIAAQRRHSRGMQRQYPLRAEFGAGHAQGGGLFVEIRCRQAQSLAKPEAGARDQPEEGDVGEWTERIGEIHDGQRGRPSQKEPDLLVGVNMGGTPAVGRADQPRRGYLRSRVENRAKPGEAPETLQALRVVKSPVRRLRQGCPLERQGGRHWLVRRDPVRVAGKLLDLRAFDPQQEPELTAMRKVPPGQRGQGRAGLCAHSGHGCASPRKISRSVWA